MALLRLASLGQIVLTDSTESRYGGVAREMARSGDSITPWTGNGRVAAAREMARSSDRCHALDVRQGRPDPVLGQAAVAVLADGDVVSGLGGIGVLRPAAEFPGCRPRWSPLTVCFAAGLWGRRVAVFAWHTSVTLVAIFVLSGACELDVSLAAGTSAAYDGLRPVCVGNRDRPGAGARLGG